LKDGGWTALDCDPDYGGQGLPYLMGTAVGEIFVAANMALNMYQGLTHGAYSAIHVARHGEQKATYLPKMVSCDWTGTMNLTEPHCGTDLGLMRTRPNRRPMAAIASPGRRSSSRPATTTWPRTSSTWCWPRRRAGARGRRASRCSSCRSSW
jgi:hypothetical protein